ncbi:MAG: cupredoxin domain-containing protein [Actinomycetota bacterium]|nr:cupredoxin domain-containing protein [Actinomycetota bacterium]
MPALRIRLSVLAVSFALSVSLAACGSSATSSSHSATSSASPSSTAQAGRSAPAHSTSVAIKSYAFHPATITVAKGAKITFTNQDQTAHTATSTQAGVFDTGTLKPGATKTITVTKPGTYTYYCQFHAFMKATVTVQ